MERDNQESQRKEVAVKKLTRQASERNGTLYEDFKNELEIMKVYVLVFVLYFIYNTWTYKSVWIKIWKIF